jgi:sugar (pentulose or hexulose) kinase
VSTSYLIGIDAGTTVMKTVVFDLAGNEIAKASSPAEIIHLQPGWAEQDMNSVWQATAKSCKEAIAKAGVKTQDIRAVSLSGQGAGTWLVDKKGKPTRYAVSWLDGRAQDIIDQWQADGTSDKLTKACGLVYYAGSGPGIIFRWFMQNDRRALENSGSVLWAKDWVRYCMTGEILTDETDPSMGLVDPPSRRYSPRVLELTGTTPYAALLPAIRPSHELGGKVTKAAAEATGLAEGTPVAVGAWDCTSTALGQGCIKSGDAFSIMGTAGIHMLVSSKPTINPSYSLSCHTVPGQYLVHSMAMTAANNLDWYEREFGLAENQAAKNKAASKYDIINATVASVPLGANGVFFLPFLQGERAPFVEARARGEFAGLADSSSRSDLYRAVYEGVALATLHNYKAMEVAGSFARVRLGGGGAQSEVWSQILADCTGRVMEITTGSEYGARGAAINAAVCAGVYKNHEEAVRQMVKVKRAHEPDPKKTREYAESFEIYVKLVESHRKLWVDMFRLAEKRKSAAGAESSGR